MAKNPYYLVKRKDRLTEGKPTCYARPQADDGALLATAVDREAPGNIGDSTLAYFASRSVRTPANLQKA